MREEELTYLSKIKMHERNHWNFQIGGFTSLFCFYELSIIPPYRVKYIIINCMHDYNKAELLIFKSQLKQSYP